MDNRDIAPCKFPDTRVRLQECLSRNIPGGVIVCRSSEDIPEDLLVECIIDLPEFAGIMLDLPE